MKKGLILAALLSIGVLVGCGNPQEQSSQPSEEQSSQVEQSSEEQSSEPAEVVGWGTEAAPLTVAQAIEKMKDWTGSEWSEVEGYLTGKVVSISKSSYGDYNAVLESSLTGKETFEIYGAYINDGVVTPVEGSTVTVKGHFTKYVQIDKDSGEPTGVVKYEIAFSKTNSYRPYIIASDAVATEPENPSSSENTSSEPNVSEPEGAVTVAKTLSSYGWANSQRQGSFTLDSNITVSVDGTATGDWGLNSGKWYDSDTTWRIYQNETPDFKITAASGYSLVSVKVSYVSAKTGILTLNNENVESDTVVPATGSSISFSVGNTGTATNGQVKVTAIEVVYTAA